ncbi:P-loop containing nucleoside triphosphate hydrolase protein [Mycena epipterygia]|nr:P-loop containing nucleoside triphosphate hydrolase protein [Mycena epipterygia]
MSLLSTSGGTSDVDMIIEPAAFAYASLLAVLSLISASRATHFNITTHLNIILLTSLAVYFYRDIVPLASFNQIPLDASEGSILWAKIGILGLAGIVVPLTIPRRYTPINSSEPTLPSQEQMCSLLSLYVYSFLDSVVFLAYRIPHLSRDLLPPLADHDVSRNLKSKSFPLLDVTSRHIFFGLMYFFRVEYTQMALLLIPRILFDFAAPLSVNRLLNYIEVDGKGATFRPWAWILLLFAGTTARSIVIQWYEYIGTRAVVQAEAIITELLFEHSLRIRVKAETSGTSVDAETKSSNLAGRLTNLATTDLRNIVDAREFVLFLVYIPVQITLCVAFLYVVLGWSAFVGLAAMLLMYPIPRILGNKIQTIQEALMKKTDARVQAEVEVMGLIRMIKLLGYERKTDEELLKKREEELGWLLKKKVVELINGCLMFAIPIVSMVVTYATYVRSFIKETTIVMKQPLSAAKVFSSMAVFNMFGAQLFIISTKVPQVVTGKVSLDRVNDFLQNTELIDEFSPGHYSPAANIRAQNSEKIGFNDVAFTWSESDDSDPPNPGKFSLQMGHLCFKRGSVNVILGPTGSGKTSLFMALLGEMRSTFTSRDSWFNLPKTGGVAYAAQESWIKNDTVKMNILFGEPFDLDRYRKVLYQCCLEPDLAMFDAGDNTEIGPLGINLSGGQRARISLARALYSSAEILLLDDPLAALDVHTSKWVVDKCLGGDLIKDRTVLLVTHNAPLVSPIAQFVVYIAEGRVVSQGSLSEAINMNPVLATMLTQKEEPLDTKETPLVENTKSNGQLIFAEEIDIGRVSWTIFWRYVRSLAGKYPWLFFFQAFLGLHITECILNLQMWYLGHWASQYEKHSPSEVNVFRYISVYSSMPLAAILIYSVNNVIYYSGVVGASRNIHQQLVRSILGATFRFLDFTPPSRVITRFTSDTREIDNPLPSTLYLFTDLNSKLVIKLTAIALFTPEFVVPGILALLLGGGLSQIYLTAQRAVKREMSNAIAPVIGHFGATISGLVSIRAYAAQDASVAESSNFINGYTRTAITFYNLNRWITLRLDIVGSIFTVSLATYLLYFHKLSAAETGFSLTLAVEFNLIIMHWIAIFNDLEVQSNSLERIHRYLEIEQEPEPTVTGVPPAYWPSTGSLQVENLTAKYSPDGPEVLHRISFTIQAGERLVVQDRARQSSLTLSLLRAIPTEGQVYYDGLATSSINLDALRSNITLIPQSPELLSGTLRYNLDPFDRHDDAALNDALRAAGLFALQNVNEADSVDVDGTVRLSLDTPISAGGSNLSVGQRQILTLARALLRQSKLLILDEATSAIDYRTDSIIQSSLRHELGKDVTVLIIAHRLQTIMDADKIMVLDAGRIVEFDSPKALLEKEDGHFRSLVDQSNDRDALYQAVLA